MKKTGDSFKGILGGIVFIIIGIGLLWWNEGNNVKNLKTTSEIEKVYVDVKSDKVDSKYEGKAIATSGKIFNEEELIDELFNVTIKTPLLVRTVEVYQWEEKEYDDEGVTRYSYDKTWSNTLIDSKDFNESGHDNPSEKKYEDKTFTAKDVKVGAFSLTTKQIEMLSTKASIDNFDQDTIDKLKLKIDGKYITNSENLEKPSIGDIRISFSYNNSTEISVLAVQKGNTFAPYTSSSGKNINVIKDGIHAGKEMIENIKSSNKTLKWILRIAGTVICMIGFSVILGPISTIANFVPILGGIVGAAVGLISFILGLCLSLIVIAIAWIRFRPILGIILLVIAGSLITFLVQKGKKKKKETIQDVEAEKEK